MRQSKDNFVTAVRKFMEMETLTPALLKELIERIDVHETEGAGKNRTQRLTIHYRFVGVVELPEFPKRQHLKMDMRQSVAIEYIPA